MIVALVAGGAEFILQQHRILMGNALYLLEGVCGYIAAVTAIALFVQKTGRAPNWTVATTVLADILFIFGSTLVSSPRRTRVKAGRALHCRALSAGLRGQGWQVLAALSHLPYRTAIFVKLHGST